MESWKSFKKEAFKVVAERRTEGYRLLPLPLISEVILEMQHKRISELENKLEIFLAGDKK